MEAWANWVATKADLDKKRIFFATMSPTHLWSVNNHSNVSVFLFFFPINSSDFLQYDFCIAFIGSF